MATVLERKVSKSRYPELLPVPASGGQADSALEGGQDSATVMQAVTEQANAAGTHHRSGSAPHDRLGRWLRSHPELTPYYAAGRAALFHGDALAVIANLDGLAVDCIVTSPPYYGQRDYGEVGQIGLERTPEEYIRHLVEVFHYARLLLRPGGSLWVVIGDTYWSGKGRPQGDDTKRKYPRFDRPQDKTIEIPWCRPKQQLLIPHRFAIAMQADGWIVRNDNVWNKPRAMPDPAEDRCALTHEYVFHFVTQRRYRFDLDAVAVPSNGKRPTKNPPSVWTIPTEPSQKKHLAVFPEQLVTLPIRATCPARGIVFDPFCGSGTTLTATLASSGGRCAVGIDISEMALSEAATILRPKCEQRRRRPQAIS